MAKPGDFRDRVAEQASWVGQLLGEDFWEQIYENMKGVRPQFTDLPGGGRTVLSPRPQAGAYPPLDMFMTLTEIVLSVALPGLTNPDHFVISLASPNSLVMEAFIPPAPPQMQALQRERVTGYFARTVQLPEAVQPGDAFCTYADGVVEVRLLRSQPGNRDGAVSLLNINQQPAR